MSVTSREGASGCGWRLSAVWKSTTAVMAAVVVMTVLSTSTHAARTPSQDTNTRMFLEELRKSDRWLRTTWTGNNFCAWTGVTCNADDTVTVNLSGRDVMGTMPEVGAHIDGSEVMVTSMDLSNNPFYSGTFKGSWGRLSALRRLDLSVTSLRGELPQDWQQMRNLEYLNISRTSACRGLPRWSPTSMSSLRVVDFSYCSFRGTLESSWGAFELKSANFRGNSFCGCLPSSWNAQSVLGVAMTDAEPGMAVSNCEVVNQCMSDANSCAFRFTAQENTREFLRLFSNAFPNQLRTVWIGNNYCTWSGVTCAPDGTVSVQLSGRGLDGNLPSIPEDIELTQVLVVSVDLSGNPRLRDRLKPDWGGLTRLRELNLSNTAVGGELPLEWNGMESLQSLDLHNTVVCGSLPDWKLPQLHYVDLSGCNFHGSLRESWMRMRLRAVRLAGNSFCGCVPPAWRRVTTLARATGPGSGINAGVRARNCATANACGPDSDTCKSPSSGSGQGVDDTLAFLHEFTRAFPVLQPTWTGTAYCSWDGVVCRQDGLVEVKLANRGLVGGMPGLGDRIDGSRVNVVHIDLSHNAGLRGSFRDDWAGLRQLQYLDLSHTGLYDPIPDAWMGMRSLQEVHIHDTAACQGLPNWDSSSLPALRVVDMSNNNMGGPLAYSWSTFTTLESVRLAGNSFCGCVPSRWSRALVAALDATAPVMSTTCWKQNMCTGTSFRCSTVKSSGNGASA